MRKQDPRSSLFRCTCRKQARAFGASFSLKNAEISCSCLDYKSINRGRTKVLKSLAQRPIGRKPLTTRSLQVRGD